jgi:RimJ/RimL family protein N-acetyltransferase
MRVYLDAVRRSDLERLGAWFGDPSNQALLVPGIAAPTGMEDEAAWFESIHARQRDGKGWAFAVRRHEDGAAIGTVGLSIGHFRHSGEFGIGILDPSARGRGLGGEAAELLLRFAFDEIGLHRVELRVFAFNEPALRLYRRLGFREEGRRRELLFRDGQFHDDIVMAMLADEYRRRPGVERPPGWIPDAVRRRPDGADVPSGR